MEIGESSKKERGILNHLSYLPRKMLLLPRENNVTEFVLHELCCKDCFNLEKAAYFVDNPDFDCLRGIAGFSRLEEYPLSCSIWDSPKDFSLHMNKAPFNQKVRNVRKESLKKSCKPDEVVAQEIAHDLGFSNAGFCAWDSQFNNHGILIFEHSDDHNDTHKNHLLNGLSLLSFCPIF